MKTSPTNIAGFFTRAAKPLRGLCPGKPSGNQADNRVAGRRRMGMALVFLAGGLIFTPAARADLSLNLDLYRSLDHNSGQTNWYAWANLNTTNTIATYYQLHSTHSIILDSIGNGGTTSTSYFSDFAGLLSEITNGDWTLVLNVGDPSQRTYTFHVTASGISDSTFPASQVTHPAWHESVSSPAVTYAWTGPTNWSALNVWVNNGDYSYYRSSTPPPDATSWNGDGSLDLSHFNYTFTLSYGTSGGAYLTCSTPMTSGSQPLADWTAIPRLYLEDHTDFFLNYASVSGHELVAHYAFDNSDSLGQDTSGNGNAADGQSWWGMPHHQFSTDAEAGGGSVQFFGVTSMVPGGFARASWDAALGGSFSLSAWVKTSAVVGNPLDDAINGATLFWAYNDHSGTNDTIPLSLTGGKAAFSTRDHLGNTTTLHSTTSVNDGHYHLVTVTRDQASGRKSVYVDGALEGAEIGTTEPLNGNDYYLSIGGTTSSSYAGLVDDMQIYAGVLSSNEVAYLYHNPGLTATNLAVAGTDFNAALNTTGLNWSTSGDTSWFTEMTNTYNGATAAAQSGSVTDSQSSTLSVTVIGPGTLTFAWSSIANDPNGSFDYEFDIDDGWQNDLMGDNDWAQDGPYSINFGTHTLSWTVRANGDTDPTQAGFLDQVSYVQDTAPVITVNPFDQTNYPGYPVWLNAGATSNPAATWQWYEVGSGAIAGATSSYFTPANSGSAGVAGSYYAIASTDVGSANTRTALVSFVSAPLPPDWSRAFKSPFQPVDNYTVTTDSYFGCAVDTNGNLYTAAEFIGAMTVGSQTLVSGSGGFAGAIVKQSPSGTGLWAAAITNNGSGNAYALSAVGAPGGGAYLAGNYSGNNWLGASQLTDAGNGDMFLARFDANGSNLWVRTFGGVNGDFTAINCLASDSSGNVTLAGNLGAGPVTIGSSNYNSEVQQGVLLQLDPTGTVRWSQVLPSEWVKHLVCNAGRLYVSFTTTIGGGTTNAAIGSLSIPTDRTWAVACLNETNGQASWVRGVGAPSGSIDGNPYYTGAADDVPRLAVSGTNLFITGAAYGSSAQFGSLTVNFGSLRGQYFARYDTNGNAQSAGTYGSVSTTPMAAVADAQADLYVSGNFDTFSWFGNDLIAAPAYGGSFNQAFLAKFDLNGHPLWVRQAVSTATVNFNGIALAADGVWASGWCQSGYYPQVVPVEFGTNNVFSDGLWLSGGPGGGTIIIWYPAGVLAKINDNVVAAQAIALSNPQVSGGNFRLSFLSQSGFTHAVQYRTNLISGLAWQTCTNVIGDNSLKTIPIPLSTFAPAKQAFIRVLTQ